MSISTWWDQSVNGVRVRRSVFIETGCKAGDTLWEAKDRFPACHSIEINSDAHAACRERFRGFPHVHVHLGDSRDILPRIIDLTRATTFYLDAHCEGSPSRVPEANTECPLLDEIRLIAERTWAVRPLIIVDDIHMMREEYWLDPNSNHALFTPEDWPRLSQINSILRNYQYLEDQENRVGIWA